MLKICPKYSKISPKYAQDMPKICPGYAQGMPGIIHHPSYIIQHLINCPFLEKYWITWTTLTAKSDQPNNQLPK